MKYFKEAIDKYISNNFVKHIKLRMSAIKNISLYIPHIFANFDEDFVKSMFEEIGKVSRVDLVAKMGKDCKPYNAAYIHFEYWYNTAYTVYFQSCVLDPNEDARFVYDDPWYWIVLENKARKFVSGERKIRIDIGELFKADVPSRPRPSSLPIAPGLSNIHVPDAPMKAKVDSSIEDMPIPINLEEQFEYPGLTAEEIAWLKERLEIDETENLEMEEIEKAIEEDETRLNEEYVVRLEEENRHLRETVEMLQLQIEDLTSYKSIPDEL